MPASRHSGINCNPGCPVEATVSLLDGKWKSVILYMLRDGPVRFNELQRRTTDVTQRVLTNQLRELEADGLIVRRVYAQVPPKVEYSLSALGETLEPVLNALKAWGDANIGLFKAPGHTSTSDASEVQASA